MNQEVARSSRAGRTTFLRKVACHSTSRSRRVSPSARRERARVVLGAPNSLRSRSKGKRQRSKVRYREPLPQGYREHVSCGL